MIAVDSFILTFSNFSFSLNRKVLRTKLLGICVHKFVFQDTVHLLDIHYIYFSISYQSNILE